MEKHREALYTTQKAIYSSPLYADALIILELVIRDWEIFKRVS